MSFRFIRFKSLTLISQEFLAETFILRGIYPDTYYDYDMYFTTLNSYFYSIVMEFMLIAETRNPK